jgi:hypothetical protein
MNARIKTALNKVVGVVILVPVVYWLIRLYIYFYKEIDKSNHLGDGSGAQILCAAAFLIALGIIIYILFPPRPFLKIYKPGTIFINLKTNQVICLEEEKIFWIWEKPFGPMEEARYPRITISAEHRHIQPITANPKVRNLEYQVNFDLRPEYCELTPASVQKLWDLRPNWKYWKTNYHTMNLEVGKQIRSQLYEFGEVKSKEISIFYNPEDDKQQLAFAKLLKEFMRESMDNSPFMITGVLFSLN